MTRLTFNNVVVVGKMVHFQPNSTGDISVNFFEKKIAKFFKEHNSKPTKKVNPMLCKIGKM